MTCFVFGAAVCATSVGCGKGGNEALYRERYALEAEWVPFWDGKDCEKFETAYTAWGEKNAARIEAVYRRWNALSESDRDELKSKTYDFTKPVLRVHGEMTIVCGLGPMSPDFDPKNPATKAREAGKP